MGLLDAFFGNDEKNEQKDDSMFNLFGYDDNQKKEIKKGNYDIWNFEEEELEDDDYYSEDDKD